MQNRQSYNSGENHFSVQPVEGMDYFAMLIYPIIASGDVTGSVIMLSTEQRSVPKEADIKLAQSAASFLGKQMEE